MHCIHNILLNKKYVDTELLAQTLSDFPTAIYHINLERH